MKNDQGGAALCRDLAPADCHRGVKPLLRMVLLIALLAATTESSGTAAIPEIESARFNERSKAEGATRFTSLSSDQTGIRSENTYSDPLMWGAGYEIFALGSTGTGVTIGDYDGDGRPDVYVVNKSDPNRLYRNLGDWRFEDVTDRAGLKEPVDAWKQAAAFADVNNDGHLDLYVSRLGAPNLLYVNKGDGRFVEQAAAAGVAVVDGSGMAAFCDYDRDGWLDFFLQTNLLDHEKKPQGQRDRLFRNRGDGTFEEVTDRAGIHGETHGHSVTWWDFNNDGWPDLYVANDFAAPDQLYRNNKDGTFAEMLGDVLPHNPFFAMGADLGDVNNDGLIDLLVSDMDPTSRTKDMRTMIEMRRLVPDLPDPSWPAQVVRNALYLNTGMPRFLEAACLAGLASTDWTWSIRFEDLDNDGRLDLHVTNGMIRDYFDSDLRVRTANLSPAERRRAVKAAPVLVERNFAFRSAGEHSGDLQFEDVSAAWGLDHAGVSFGAAFGDLDGDGDLDVVLVNYEGKPTVCRNDSRDGHSIIVALRGTVSNRFGVGAKVRIETAAGVQVRELVLARGYMSSSEPVLHFGLGAEEVVKRLTVVWPSGREQTFENLAANRRYTISETGESGVIASGAIAEGGLFEEVSGENGLALFSKEPAIDELKAEPLLPFRQNRFGPGVAISDLNGDGQEDVVLGGATGEPAQIVLTENGAFMPPLTSSRTVGAADAALLILEVDGDGKNDLLLLKGGVSLAAGDGGYQPRLFLNRGGRRFQQAPEGTMPAFASSAGPAVAADFDGDGRLDVFLGGRVVPGAYGETPRSALWINRGGTFSDEIARFAPALATVGMVSGALATDVDQDGRMDLLIATQWGEVQCWRNVNGKGFENVSEHLGFAQAGAGWWNSLAAADFNGDGRIDYVVGNVGLNTPYRATRENPVLLYRGDFDSNGRTDLIEATSVGGVLAPRRGRSSMVAAMSSIARKFPTFAAYAAADLPGIVGAEPLRNAKRLQATELRSGVFLSQPGGMFHFEALPHLAQIAPIFGLVAGDFDGDGLADICAAQNSYAPIPETGRFDGGLGQFLRGDGKGGFFPVPPRESHLIIPGDGKALAVVDLNEDGWADLIATRNNQSVLVFRNGGRAGGNSFSVTLRGSAQNPAAIGARVELVVKDGSTQVAEVTAGGGYLSQSSPACFFGFRDGNAPYKVKVTWPGGSTTTHLVPEGSRKIVINRD